MSDLFSDAASERMGRSAPLAQRLRPRTLDEFVGQEHVLGEHSALRLAIAEDRVRSSIFYGPPGTGKTTLARIVATTTGAEFEELSAVSATVKDVREVLARARERLGGSGRRTILFLDEIHRFNKAQQDALLPAVEDGLVTLIGATTENPYFEVNSALLSRTQVYELESLSPAALQEVVRRGVEELGTDLVAGARGADRAARRRRRALGTQHRRARRRHGRRTRRRDHGGARRGRRTKAPCRLRQECRRALRLHVGVHQVDARQRSRRRGVLPRRDARGRRGRALHRAPHDRARVRGHRQRRPACAARRRGGRAGGRARRPAGGAPQSLAGGDLPRARAEVERELHGDQQGDRRRARARPREASEVAARRQLLRTQARQRQGLHLPAQRPARLRGRLPAGRAEGPDVLRALR